MAGAKKNQASLTAEMLAAVAGGAAVSGPETAKADEGGKVLVGDAVVAPVGGAAGTDPGTTQTSEGGSVVVDEGATTKPAAAGEGAALTLPPPGVPGVAVSGDVSPSAVAAVLAASEPAFVTETDGSFVSDAEAAKLGAPTPAPVLRQLLARVLVEGRFGKVNDVVRVTEDELQASAGELCGHPASVAYAKSL